MDQISLMDRLLGSYHAARARGLDALVAKKLDLLRSYDVPAMSSVLAICYWGRSGSLLLASFLDGHPETVMLAASRSQRLYEFFERNRSVPLKEKLVTYPVYSESYGQPFFYGDFPIAEDDYFAAIDALFAVYGNQPAEFLASRRTFFQFAHVAYSLALDRRPTTPRPVMIYAQHHFDPVQAAQLIDDFPKACFVHAIRAPIATFDSWFDTVVRMNTDGGEIPHPGYLVPVVRVYDELLSRDRPQPGVTERTRAVRFEDMHISTENTLRSVAEWLGISYLPLLCESKFNGISYLAGTAGKDWTGARPEQAQRQLRSTSRFDQMMIFAVLYENFVAWDYACPNIFRHVWLRRLIVNAFYLLPLRMEIAAARIVMRLQVRPFVRKGDYSHAFRALARLFTSHFDRARIVSRVLKRRTIGHRGALEWPDRNVPGQFQVLRPIQPPASEEAAPATNDVKDPDALARVLTAKYWGDDQLKFDPRGEIGLDAAEASLCVGQAVSLLAPLIQAIRDHVFAAGKIHAVDKPVTTLSVQTGQRKAGRAWIYVRDDRPFLGTAGPAVAFHYSPDRRPERMLEHLRSFAGFLQADMGPEFAEIYDPGRITPGPVIEVACWARCRLNFSDIWGATQSDIAWQALDRIAAIYAIDAEARFKPPAVRLDIRASARPLLLSFYEWAEAQLRRIDRESALAGAFQYALKRRDALTRFLGHGILEIDNQCAESALRGVRLSERSWALAGSDLGGEHAADIYSLIVSARLNNVSPRVYLRDVLSRLMAGDPVDQSSRLLPWNWSAL